jgi:hypothetical protein
LEQRLALIQRQFRERNPDATLSTAGAVRIAMLRGLDALPETKDSTD